MSSRSVFRRKVVLPITIIRRNTQEKLLAHTLDLTETSARVGGLAALLEPGETIEVQRGGVKARFQVFWMGAPSSAMAGQAGIRSLEPGKSVWGVILPEDEPDFTVDPGRLRDALAPVRSSGQFPGEQRWHTRYSCTGSASVKQQGVAYPVHAEVKDISRGGVYLEMSTPLLVDAQITVTVNVLGISFQTAGTVRTSYPLVGMGIAFNNLSAQNQEKIAQMIARIQQETSTRSEINDSPTGACSQNLEPSPRRLCLSTYPVRELTAACEALASDCGSWKSAALPVEIQELRDALSMLQHKLSDGGGPEIELMDFYSMSASKVQ
ncbi:MAG TPA: PilZ domain-containing protein [Candidatus Angelobacter sp.]|jgi:hypothetical protein|nr:PilZ domain-containing protein [Candidatus Angelobacter sp.]